MSREWQRTDIPGTFIMPFHDGVLVRNRHGIYAIDIEGERADERVTRRLLSRFFSS